MERYINFGIYLKKKILKNKKVRFFKTHNALLKVFDREFTSPKYTLGTIYVVRGSKECYYLAKKSLRFPKL